MPPCTRATHSSSRLADAAVAACCLRATAWAAWMPTWHSRTLAVTARSPWWVASGASRWVATQRTRCPPWRGPGSKAAARQARPSQAPCSARPSAPLARRCSAPLRASRLRCGRWAYAAPRRCCCSTLSLWRWLWQCGSACAASALRAPAPARAIALPSERTRPTRMPWPAGMRRPRVPAAAELQWRTRRINMPTRGACVAHRQCRNVDYQ
mmetsp:Transcript_54885/g.151984  ORF Transcript_54885/g.151984 Transcript_54885/m.151984 type:complete len:211 (+) Transcript_54885:1363-1995(+)